MASLQPVTAGREGRWTATVTADCQWLLDRLELFGAVSPK